jgi:hypothetical protein
MGADNYFSKKINTLLIISRWFFTIYAMAFPGSHGRAAGVILPPDDSQAGKSYS